MNDSTPLDRLEAEARDLAQNKSRIRVTVRIPYSVQFVILSQIEAKYGVLARTPDNDDLRLTLAPGDATFVFPPRERAPEHVEFSFRWKEGQ